MKNLFVIMAAVIMFCLIPVNEAVKYREYQNLDNGFDPAGGPVYISPKWQEEVDAKKAEYLECKQEEEELRIVMEALSTEIIPETVEVEEITVEVGPDNFY